MIKEDQSFVMQQSIGNTTTIDQRYIHISKHKHNNPHQSSSSYVHAISSFNTHALPWSYLTFISLSQILLSAHPVFFTPLELSCVITTITAGKFAFLVPVVALPPEIEYY
tara:strand:- start:166 stop:495 length:330 start_codon:yes stop_codon:yes gene_type:complete